MFCKEDFNFVNEVERPMRVLGRPLYRYEPKSDKLNDGAIFGIFMDWDPEIILVIEAKETSSGSRWQFAAARFSSRPLRLEHKGTEVWRFAGGNLGGPTDQYYSKHGVSFRSAVATQD